MLALALSGCASDPVPDVAYYRLRDTPAPPIANVQPLKAPLEVQTFLADGVYNEQAILYLNESSGSLRGYHYQLWGDPPVRLLQRRLIETLRKNHVSPLVADRLPSEDGVLRVIGLIRHFEREKTSGAWQVKVAFEFRVEGTNGEKPLLLKEYADTQPAADDTMPATVRAFGDAVDRCFVQLIADLQQLKS
jgi:ABC-type uncharacterized transport system auxiliary subunit